MALIYNFYKICKYKCHMLNAKTRTQNMLRIFFLGGGGIIFIEKTVISLIPIRNGKSDLKATLWDDINFRF